MTSMDLDLVPEVANGMADLLESWAQNEEIVNSKFTAHGADCMAVAEFLRAMADWWSLNAVAAKVAER